MRMSVCGVRAPSHGPRTVRAGARLRAVGQAPRAGLVLVEVGVRHVERHSRLRPPDELAALHALLNDGSRYADVRHAADAVARELAADDEAQPPARRSEETMNERASSCVRAPMSPHCRAASPSAATVSSACTSGEASPYAPNTSPRVWPNERSRSRMGLVSGALY